MSWRLLERAVAANQTVGRTIVVEHGLSTALDFWNDAPRQNLAQLDAPLVERINVPEDALREDGVLVKGHELTQCLWREPLGENYVRWPVAFEDSVGDEPVRYAFSLHFFGGLTERKRLGL